MTRRRSDPFLREPRRWVRSSLATLVIAILLTGLWFGAVDRSWFVEECYDCGLVRDMLEYRIFGHVVQIRDYCHETFMQLAAEELGVPCPHHHLARWHKHRYWGLSVCADPCINGIHVLVGDESEWPALLDELRVLADEEPTLRNDFFQRVLRHHDYEYGRTLMAEVRCRLDAASSAPAQFHSDATSTQGRCAGRRNRVP